VKLHELHPAPGSRRERTRVGRGIAAGKGKTAGRGTKGQRSRTGSSIPAWFEGGQTPIHMRVPKLRGFKNRFRVEYAVVNLGRIEAAIETKRLDPGPKGTSATVNAELLFQAGVVGRLDRPLKVLGGGELTHRITAIADAFSAEARRKIEAAGGTVMVLEVPGAPPKKTRPAAAEEARATSESPAETAPERGGAEPQPSATEAAATDEAAEATATDRATETAGAGEAAPRPARRTKASAAGTKPQASGPASTEMPAPAAPRRSRTKAAQAPDEGGPTGPAEDTAAKPTRRTRKAPEQPA
jgi:large subunit ribosomal protein L15